MSGTETILLVVLGFALASLIALFMGRMLWAAAVKVGVRRMQRQVPTSLVGLQTERDRLRAEYAMLAQRLGAQLEETKLRLAENMAEVSRLRNRAQEAESSEAIRMDEMRGLQSKVQQLEVALGDATSRESDLRQALAATEESLRKLRRKNSHEGHTIPDTPAEDPERRLRQRINRLSELTRAQPSSQDSMPTLDPIADRLAEAERQTAELEASLRKLDTDWRPATDNIIPLVGRPRGQ
jgi:chromosome segregation ATPase